MPPFSREIWPQYGKLRGRTNNSAEGFDSWINKAVDKNNPKFYDIIHNIKDMQFENKIELSRSTSGERD